MNDLSAANASPAPIDPKFVNILWASVDQAAELAQMHAKAFKKNWDEPTFAGLLSNPASTASFQSINALAIVLMPIITP